jgi:hypothetical protein
MGNDNEIIGKTIRLEFVKQAVGISSELREITNWTLWRGRPPSKRKKNLIAVLA